MKWEVHVPDRAKAGQPATVTVEAPNWKAALNAGLVKLAEQPGNSSAHTCEIREDGSVHVYDPSRRRGFMLRDLDYKPRPAPTPSPEAVAAAVARRSLLPSAPRVSFVPATASMVPTVQAHPAAPATPVARAARAAPVAPAAPTPQAAAAPTPAPQAAASIPRRKRSPLFFSRTRSRRAARRCGTANGSSPFAGYDPRRINVLLMNYYNSPRGGGGQERGEVSTSPSSTRSARVPNDWCWAR